MWLIELNLGNFKIEWKKNSVCVKSIDESTSVSSTGLLTWNLAFWKDGNFNFVQIKRD